MQKAHIVFMAGGTGGHIFPALAVAQKFKEQGYFVSWMGTPNSMEARIVPKYNIEIDFIPIQNVRGKGLLRWLLLPFRLSRAILVARRVLKARQAGLVVGMGGFVSGPGALAAKSLKIPLLIHEQNAVAGMTNRYLAKLANTVLCGFPHAFKPSVHAEYVGNPVRSDLAALHALATLPAHQPLHVLVIGGSLGAQILNQVVPEAMALLSKDSVELWQQTGEKLHADASAYFDKAKIAAKVTPFIEDMASAYQWADLVICRAGALTLAELMATKKPSILVPLPHAADDHQRLNAQFLSHHHAAILIPQTEFTAEHLKNVLDDLIAHPEKIAAMAEAAGKLASLNAVDKILERCVELLR